KCRQQDEQTADQTGLHVEWHSIQPLQLPLGTLRAQGNVGSVAGDGFLALAAEDVAQELPDRGSDRLARLAIQRDADHSSERIGSGGDGLRAERIERTAVSGGERERL